MKVIRFQYLFELIEQRSNEFLIRGVPTSKSPREWKMIDRQTVNEKGTRFHVNVIATKERRGARPIGRLLFSIEHLCLRFESVFNGFEAETNNNKKTGHWETSLFPLRHTSLCAVKCVNVFNRSTSRVYICTRIRPIERSGMKVFPKKAESIGTNWICYSRKSSG